jgi:hypothetical protein
VNQKGNEDRKKKINISKIFVFLANFLLILLFHSLKLLLFVPCFPQALHSLYFILLFLEERKENIGSELLGVNLVDRKLSNVVELT